MAAGHSFILGAVIIGFGGLAIYRFQMWEEWLTLALGLWLIMAPFALGFSLVTAAMWNHVLVGVLIGVDAVWVMLQKTPMAKAV